MIPCNEVRAFIQEIIFPPRKFPTNNISQYRAGSGWLPPSSYLDKNVFVSLKIIINNYDLVIIINNIMIVKML